MVMRINEANFHKVVNSDVPVVVDFWAPWCGPCKMLGPIMEEIARELKGTAKIAKLNVDDNPDIAEQLKVSNLPTVLVFRNGRVIDRFVGFMPKSAIIARLQRYVY